MRGTPIDVLTAHAESRIIPADAGNTPRRNRQARSPWDHPRGCGEHIVIGSRNRGDEGSSPRMRGTHVTKENSVYGTGIIPADAGNTK